MSSLTLLSALDAGLRRLPKPLLLALGLGSVAALAMVDAAGHHSLPLETFYVAPVLAVAWLTGSTRDGFVVALAAALVRPAEALVLAPPPAAPSPNLALFAFGALVQLLLYLVLLWLLATVRADLARRQAEAQRDALTGIANGRAFRLIAEAEIERSRRYRHELSLLYLDIDDFKAVNDRCGHAEGDRLLQRLVAVLGENLRSVDAAARLGGDEFAVLMPETGSRAAGQLAMRLMAALAAETTSAGAPLSCSCGLATFRLAPTSVAALLAAGDRLMYEAKAAGKNRLCRAVLPAVRTAPAGVGRGNSAPQGDAQVPQRVE